MGCCSSGLAAAQDDIAANVHEKLLDHKLHSAEKLDLTLDEQMQVL